MAVTDKEKGEMFKRLLNDTMETHEKDSSITSELCDNIENETKAKLNTIQDFDQLGIVVTAKEFDEILKKSGKTWPAPDKIC